MVADNKFIGHRIRLRREEQGISQEKLGEMIGVTYQQIQKYEKGVNKVSAERLSIIAGCLDVPIVYFFENNEFSVSEEHKNKLYGVITGKTLTIQEKELLAGFRSLPDKSSKSNLVGFLKSITGK